MIKIYIYIILYTVHFFSKCHGILTDFFVFFAPKTTRHRTPLRKQFISLHRRDAAAAGVCLGCSSATTCTSVSCRRPSSDEMLCGECSLWRMDLGFNMTKGRPISCLGLCLGLMKHQQLLSEVPEVTCGEVIKFPQKNVETNGNMWSSTKHKSAEQDLCL